MTKQQSWKKIQNSYCTTIIYYTLVPVSLISINYLIPWIILKSLNYYYNHLINILHLSFEFVIFFVFAFPFLSSDSHWKWGQKLRGEARSLWRCFCKIFTISARNSPWWSVFENRVVWSEIKARWIQTLRLVLSWPNGCSVLELCWIIQGIFPQFFKVNVVHYLQWMQVFETGVVTLENQINVVLSRKTHISFSSKSVN